MFIIANGQMNCKQFLSSGHTGLALTRWIVELVEYYIFKKRWIDKWTDEGQTQNWNPRRCGEGDVPRQLALLVWIPVGILFSSVWPDWAVFATYLVTKFSYECSPNTWQVFGLFWKMDLLSEIFYCYFLIYFWIKFGYFLFQHLLTLTTHKAATEAWT